jgi:hypothetical protein
MPVRSCILLFESRLSSRTFTSDTLPPMADAVLLSIDLPKLHDHFAANGEQMSFEAVETWLRQTGFQQTDDGWIAEEVSLMALDWTVYRILKRL